MTRKVVQRRRALVTPRPFLKWAGGKGQLVDRLLDLVPHRFEGYLEPFFGGGALFFALHRKGMLQGKRVVLADLNQELINTMKSVRDEPRKVLHYLEMHRNQKDHYYRVRELDPAGLEPAQAAARMIFLNRTGFNGLYRVNSKGKFNVPFGKNPGATIADEENIMAVSQAFESAEIVWATFVETLAKARKGDFVYLDPPYVPMSETANFTGYAREGFGPDDQEELARAFEEITERGVKAMMSNSGTDFVRQRYSAFDIVEVRARRFINRDAGSRGPVPELVVRNF